MYTGCGVIATSAVLGAGFRFRLRGNTADLKNAELFLFGGVVHIAMLFWMVTLPAEIRWQVIRSIALPVLLVYPLGTLLVGRILAGLDKVRISETAVRESEEEFRSLAESMPQIVWATRADGWNIYFNQQWVDYTGMTLEESYGQGWNKPFHPDDRQRAWDAWQNATQNNATYSLECRLRRFDGIYRWWLVRGVPQLNAAGETVKWYGTCTDIEQIKQADEEHQETRSWLAAALQSMTDAVFISDADGNFIETNHAFAAFHRFKEEECAKTLAEYPDILDVYFPNGEKAPLDMWAVPRALRGEIGQNIEYSLRRKDTGETWVGSYCFAPIRDPNGAITGSVVVGRDITEKKQAQQKLLDSEERFNIAADAASIGIWEFDIPGEQLAWDHRMFQLYGISPDEFSGVYEAWHGGLHPEDQQRVMDEVTAATVGEKEFNTEFRIIRPDGETRHIRAHGKVIRAEDGTPLRMIGTNQDITERKRTEAALVQKVHEISQLKDFSIGLATMAPGENLEENITKKLKEICGAIGVSFNAYHPERKVLIPLHIEVESKFFDVVQKQLKRLSKDMSSSVSDEMFEAITTQVVGVRKTLHEITYGAIPKPIGAAIQKLLKVDRFIGIPYFLEGKLYGTSMILMGKDVPDPSRELLENLALLCAVTLRRKQAEQKLQTSEEKLRGIIENSTNMFYSHTIDHVLTYLSPQVKNILGYEVEEALRRWTDLAGDHPANERGLQLTQEAIRTGKAQPTYELQLIHKDGHPVWVEVREAPSVENGKTVAMVGSLTDITARRATEEDLRNRNNELERFNKAAVGRELRMVELKEEINRLCCNQGTEEPYPLHSQSPGGTNE
jgi:PAS domain S-box-containing protein